MDSLFYLKLFLTFISGSLIVTLATVAAEKFGSKAGGFIAGLPTTIVIALFFIGLVQTPRMASEATDVVPLAVGFNGVFLVVYAILIRRGLIMGIGGALGVWLFLSALVYISDFRSFAASLVVYLFLLVGSYLFLEKKLMIPSTGGAGIRYSRLQIVWRALFSGSIVTLGVWLAKVGGPVLGGIFAPFPAVFISTLIISCRSRGAEFSRMVTKPLLISGMVNVVVYAAAARYLYPATGLIPGTLLAYLVSGVGVYGTYLFIKAKMR